MLNWKWAFMTAGACVMLYGCSAMGPAASSPQTQEVQMQGGGADSGAGGAADAAAGGAADAAAGGAAEAAAGGTAAAAAGGAADAAGSGDTAGAQGLCELRNPMIGDASADGKLVTAVKQQFGITEISTMELKTDKEPYELVLHFATEPDSQSMEKAAAVLLSLIDNCGKVTWDYYDDQSSVATALTTVSMDVQSASRLAGVDDIKSYSRTAGTVGELLGLLENPHASARETTPADTAPQEAPVSGFG